MALVGVRLTTQLIHDNFKYSGTDDPSYVSSDGLDRIRKDSEVRLKIVGTCIENTEIVRAFPPLSLPLPGSHSCSWQHRSTAVVYRRPSPRMNRLSQRWCESEIALVVRSVR